MKKMIKKNYKWITILICLVLFLALMEDVFNKEIMRGDIIGYRVISKLISNKLTPIVKVITSFASVWVILIVDLIFSIYFIIKKRKDISFKINLNLVLVTILNLILKNIVQRPRPTEYRIINETGYSFPSGHSMVSMAFYGYFIYLIYKNVNNKYLKWISMFLLFILIILIGISRIYLGVHYTSDVIAGFLVSIAYLFTFIDLTNKIGEK